jgi:hypothetical protein
MGLANVFRLCEAESSNGSNSDTKGDAAQRRARAEMLLAAVEGIFMEVLRRRDGEARAREDVSIVGNDTDRNKKLN